MRKREAFFSLPKSTRAYDQGEISYAEGVRRKISARFMVRGHWRRANPSRTDQRQRWIEPYWKGPEIATVIEREYRLRE